PVVEGHPAPGIARDPHVASSGIISETAGQERVPAGADEVGLPDVAEAGDGHEVAVIIQVAHAVAIGRGNGGPGGGSVASMIIGLLAVPVVGGIVFEILGDDDGVFLGGIVGL